MTSQQLWKLILHRLPHWAISLILLLFATQSGSAEAYRMAITGAPGIINYQGQVTTNGQPFDGTGYFKFAVVGSEGATNYWANDGTPAGQPATGIPLRVNNGLFSVLLGDTHVSGMTHPLEPAVFSETGRSLRVWFSADGSSYTLLIPDQRIATVPYALVSEAAVTAANADMLNGMSSTDFSPAQHQHDLAYVNDNTREVGDDDVPAGGLSPDRIQGNAWTAANDGNGSGLDADTLDGLDSTAFQIPSGAIVLGVPGDTRLLAAGFESWGLSSLSIADPNGQIGKWGTAPSTDGAPQAAFEQTAIWTGTEMIVWGDENGSCTAISGGRYNPVTDTWRPITNTNAPSDRCYHKAIWTGSEMIIWGGWDFENGALASGARYNPVTDTWTPVSTATSIDPRFMHSVVWTGTEMIVWGGVTGIGGFTRLNSGGRYNPSTDTWAVVSITNAPQARVFHTAVWTGSEVVIWGGDAGGGEYHNTGGRYHPATDTWIPTTLSGAPAGRQNHSAIWTGTEMIIWGGESNFAAPGWRYNPATDSWALLSMINAPASYVTGHTAEWTGAEMIVWGGRVGGGLVSENKSYNPVTDRWTPISSTSAPTAREKHSVVWTGADMIIWGGIDESVGYRTCTGGRLHLLLELFRKP